MTGSDVLVALGGAATGLVLGPVLRGRIFFHSVPADEPWRRDCPHCRIELVRPGWRGALAVLPATGRCPRCGGRVGPPAALVELAAAGTVGLLGLTLGWGAGLLTWAWVALVGVALVFIDLAVCRLPDRLTVAAFVGGAVALVVAGLVDGDLGRAGSALLGGVGLAAFYLLLIFIYPHGMGLGDAKFAASLGSALGWYGWAVTVYGAAAGFLLAGLVSGALLVAGRVTRATRLPHGPFMLVGAVLTVAFLS